MTARITPSFPTRKEVDGANQSRLDQLPGEAITFKSKDEGGWDPNGVPLPSVHVQDLLNRLIAPEVITLKVGAQVMLLKVSPFVHLRLLFSVVESKMALFLQLSERYSRSTSQRYRWKSHSVHDR